MSRKNRFKEDSQGPYQQCKREWQLLWGETLTNESSNHNSGALRAAIGPEAQFSRIILEWAFWWCICFSVSPAPCNYVPVSNPNKISLSHNTDIDANFTLIWASFLGVDRCMRTFISQVSRKTATKQYDAFQCRQCIRYSVPKCGFF